MYEFDLISHYWRKIETFGQTPRATEGHSMCLINSNIYIAGGYSSSTYFNEIHTINLKEREWKKLNITMDAPRSLHTMCSTKDGIVFFGGWNSLCLFFLNNF